MIEKLLLLHGVGATGKSSLVRFLTSFVYTDLVISSEFKHISNQFEKSSWIDKTLLLFNDEVVDPSKKDFDGKMSNVKRISGGDLSRVEIKYGDVTSTSITPLIIITTNSKVNITESKDFGALLRRFISIQMKNVVTLKNRKEAIISEDIRNNEIGKLILFFQKNRSYIPQIISYLNKSLISDVIITSQDSNNYSEVDSLLSFTSHHIKILKGKDMPVFLFFARYLDYFINYYNLNIEIPKYDTLMKLISSIVKTPFDLCLFKKLIKEWESLSDY